MGRLPSGYQELTYIESTGTQRILVPNVTRAEITAIMCYPAIVRGGVGGSDGTGNSGRLSLGANDNGYFSFNLGDKTSPSSRLCDNKTHTYELKLSTDKKTGSLYIDGELLYSQTTGTTNNPTEFYLFAYRGYESVTNCSVRISRYIIGDLYDFISCRRLSDGAIGMYDLVSQSFFGNSGTGSFIAGAPIIEPTWGSGLAQVTQKELLARRFAITPNRKERGRLPSGYQELTYIESTGTQWIDTGLTISSDSVFVLDSVFVPHDIGSGSLFGSSFVDSTGHASRRFWLSLYNSQLYCAYGTLNTSFLDLSVGDRYSINLNFKNNIQTVSVNGTSYSFSGYTDGSITTNLLFFARSNYSTNLPEDFSLVSLGEVSFSIDDSVFDFIPCRRLSDNAIGMYDLVSQSFFGNSGTGEFIAGVPV